MTTPSRLLLQSLAERQARLALLSALAGLERRLGEHLAAVGKQMRRTT